MVSDPCANPYKTCSWKNSSPAFGRFSVCVCCSTCCSPPGGGCTCRLVSVCPQHTGNATHGVPCTGGRHRPQGASGGTTQAPHCLENHQGFSFRAVLITSQLCPHPAPHRCPWLPLSPTGCSLHSSLGVFLITISTYCLCPARSPCSRLAGWLEFPAPHDPH